MKEKRILCFAPHPDDEVLGCGGFLLKAKSLHHRIGIVYMTCGENGSPIYSPQELKKIRLKETREVCKYLDIKPNDTSYLNMSDGDININTPKNFRKLMQIIRTFKPDIALIPHKNDQSFDHRETSNLVKKALDMSGSNNFIGYGKEAWWTKTILGYEVWSPIQDYSYVLDISKFAKEKIKLLSFYKSQTKDSGNVSDFVGEKALHLNGYRAAMNEGEYMEVFEVLKTSDIL